MLQLKKQLQVISGSNDDNVLTFVNANPETNQNSVSISINSSATLDILQTIYLTFSNKIDNDNYTEFLRVALGDAIRIPSDNVIDVALSYLQMYLLGCTEVNSITNVNGKVSFKSNKSIRVEALSSIKDNLQYIRINNSYTEETVVEDDLLLYKRVYTFGQSKIDYIINQLVLNSPSFEAPIVLKKVNANNGVDVRFNLRDVFGSINMRSSVELNPCITYQEREGSIKEILPLETVYIIPNSKDLIYNTYYTKYYSDTFKNKFSFLTVNKDSNRLVRNKEYVISYISIEEPVSDKLVVELYDNRNMLFETVEETDYTSRGIIRDFKFDTFNMANVAYLKLYILRGNDQITKPLKLDVYSYCRTVDYPMIYFQNSVGGTDCFNMFNKHTKHITNGEEQTYVGEFKGERNIAYKKANQSLILTTELLTKNEAELFTELCKSSNVYYYINGEERRIIIQKYDISIDSKSGSYIGEVEIDDIDYIKEEP